MSGRSRRRGSGLAARFVGVGGGVATPGVAVADIAEFGAIPGEGKFIYATLKAKQQLTLCLPPEPAPRHANHNSRMKMRSFH